MRVVGSNFRLLSRRINITGGSDNVADQIADDSSQNARDAFTNNGIRLFDSRRVAQRPNPAVAEGEVKAGFQGWHTGAYHAHSSI